MTHPPSWNYYFKRQLNMEPNDVLTFAIEQFNLEHVQENRFAIDLGCGSGSDTFELLKNRWQVLAIDKEQTALSLLSKQLSFLNLSSENLSTMNASFESLQSLPKSDLINATLSLPFVKPLIFYDLLNRLQASIVIGGRFSGVFFGSDDEWSSRASMTFLEETRLRQLFASFKIEYFQEKKYQNPTLSGKWKKWHTYHIVAQKQE